MMNRIVLVLAVSLLGSGVFAQAKPDCCAATSAGLCVLVTVSTETLSDAPPRQIGPGNGSDTIAFEHFPLRQALAAIYHVQRDRVLISDKIPPYALNICVRRPQLEEKEVAEILERSLVSALSLDVKREPRTTDVLVLRAADDKAAAAAAANAPAPLLAFDLEKHFGTPVLNETGITDWSFENFHWDNETTASISDALRSKYGLELSPVRREIEFLVVNPSTKIPNVAWFWPFDY
jgi:hypothetical protein